MQRARQDEGFGLVEVLIAMTILSVGIMAITAGFSSGMEALKRASRASTAGAIADAEMEAYRQLRWASIPLISPPVETNPVGADGRMYWMSKSVTHSCPQTGATLDMGTTPPTCVVVTSGVATVVSEAPKLVTVEVRDGSATDRILITTSSTFASKSTG